MTEIFLRLATEKDCELLWHWRNEEAVRQQSFNRELIPYETHRKWFLDKLNNADTKIFIICHKDRNEIGQARLDKNDDDSYEISISLDTECRNKGYGTCALELVCQTILQGIPQKKIIAHIKKENIASIKAFAKAGFQNKGIKYFEGQEAIEMVWISPGNEKF